MATSGRDTKSPLEPNSALSNPASLLFHPMSVDQQRKDNLACSDKVNHADLDAKPIPETRIEAPETIKQALTRHPWTIVWLVYGIWMVACNSFDSSAGSTVLGIPKFRQDYGFMYNSNYVLPAKWQSAYSGGPAAAQVIGTFMGGGKFSYTF